MFAKKTFEIRVQAADGRTYRARVEGKNAQQAMDLALADLRRRGVRPLKASAEQLVWAF